MDISITANTLHDIVGRQKIFIRKIQTKIGRYN